MITTELLDKVIDELETHGWIAGVLWENLRADNPSAQRHCIYGAFNQVTHDNPQWPRGAMFESPETTEFAKVLGFSDRYELVRWNNQQDSVEPVLARLRQAKAALEPVPAEKELALV
mgnify:CR=1 FL=1